MSTSNGISAATKIFSLIGSAGVVVGSLVGFGWWAGIKLNTIQSSVASNNSMITREIAQLTKAVERESIANQDKFRALWVQVIGRAPDGFHRRDMAEWCDKTEKMNGSWVCADPYDLPSFKTRPNRIEPPR